MDSKDVFASLMEDDSPALDPRALASSSARAPSPTPGGRFRLRRSPPTSPSPSPPIKTGSPLSCVTRDASCDDCATQRFIVWAAVKRNACPRLSASERLECPLLRCRRRCPDHESMLRHLAGCEHLADGEYWCYGCMRPERFDDARCRKCLGHPSRRRRMLAMAKTFFSSLGHGPRRQPSLEPVPAPDDALAPPPSYDSLGLGPQPGAGAAGAELFSNEILELDATQLAAATAADPPADAAVNPQKLILPELDSAGASANPLMQWQPAPALPAIPPGHQAGMPAAARPPGPKPSLQLNTQGLEQFMKRRATPRPAPRPSAPGASRSAHLAPSSSVRSTTSTLSNISSVVSPVSAWSAASHAWSGAGTDLTSPTADLASPGGLLPDAAAWGPPDPRSDPPCPPDFLHDMLVELPADMPPPRESPDCLSADPMLFSFDLEPAMDFSYATDLVLAEDGAGPAAAAAAADPRDEGEQPPAECPPDTASLVASAWDALQEHVASSSAKLRGARDNNPLCGRLASLPAAAVASAGLRALRRAVDGRPPASPLDALCFAHVVYSLSLVVHEDDAPSQAGRLFAQCVAYGREFAPQDRGPYRAAVSMLWQPNGVAGTDGAADGAPGSLHRSASSQGRQRAAGGDGVSRGAPDALLATALHFLDELEASAILSESPASLAAPSSELWTEHARDQDAAEALPSSPFAIAVSYMLGLLARAFPASAGLRPRLAGVQRRVDRGAVRSVRRLELEMLQAGKACIPPAAYFDGYAPEVRDLCSQLYEQHAGGASRRGAYHLLGVALVESAMAELGAGGDPAPGGEPLISSLAGPTLLLLPAGLGDAASAGGGPRPSTPPPGAAEPAHARCDVCGYRPRGDPQWFRGSMAKHKRLQHSAAPPRIYSCPFPGCASRYRNRPDNLRQHQLEKGHFVAGAGAGAGAAAAAASAASSSSSGRPSKRKKMS